MKTIKADGITMTVNDEDTVVLCAVHNTKTKDGNVIIKGGNEEIAIVLSILNNAVIKGLVEEQGMSKEEAILFVGKALFVGAEDMYEDIADLLIKQEVPQ